MTNRRAFLLGIGAALAAPAIVRAESIMRVVVPQRGLIMAPDVWVPYGLSPAADALVDLAALRARQWAEAEAWLAVVNAEMMMKIGPIAQLAFSDAIRFGHGAIKIEAGGISHVPYDLVPIDVWNREHA